MQLTKNRVKNEYSSRFMDKIQRLQHENQVMNTGFDGEQHLNIYIRIFSNFNIETLDIIDSLKEVPNGKLLYKINIIIETLRQTFIKCSDERKDDLGNYIKVLAIHRKCT